MRGFALEWEIARRYLRGRRRDGYVSVISVISFLGIMLGVATLIVVLAVMNGFRADLLDRILGVSGHGVIRPYNGIFVDRDGLAAQISKIDGVMRTNPVIDAQVLVSAPRGVRGAVVRGVPSEITRLPLLAASLVNSSLQTIAIDEIVIGARLAQYFQLTTGDHLALISPRGTETPFGTTPRIRHYRIAGVFSIGLSDYDFGVIFMSLPAAAELSGQNIEGGALEISIRDPEAITMLTAPILDVIGEAHYFIDWKRSNATLAGTLEVERNVMFLILTLILLVASLNIVSGMVMLVRDKARNIAVLRSMGARRAMILRIFFMTGATIGVAGTLFGLALGIFLCANIETIRQILSYLTGANLFPAEVYFLDKLPAQMEWGETLSVLAMALTLSFLSTLYPAWRAASMTPIEALRYE